MANIPMSQECFMEINEKDYSRGKYRRRRIVAIRISITEFNQMKKLAKKKEKTITQLIRSGLALLAEKENELV